MNPFREHGGDLAPVLAENFYRVARELLEVYGICIYLSDIDKYSDMLMGAILLHDTRTFLDRSYSDPPLDWGDNVFGFAKAIAEEITENLWVEITQ